MQKTAIEPEINTSIKMEVGIEDCLHIEFEYNKSKCVSRLSLSTLLGTFSLKTRPGRAGIISRTWY